MKKREPVQIWVSSLLSRNNDGALLSLHALALFEELESKHGRAHTHNHLGLLYTRRGLWKKAEEHLKRACDLWRDTGDIHSLIYGLENLGAL